MLALVTVGFLYLYPVTIQYRFLNYRGSHRQNIGNNFQTQLYGWQFYHKDFVTKIASDNFFSRLICVHLLYQNNVLWIALCLLLFYWNNILNINCFVFTFYSTKILYLPVCVQWPSFLLTKQYSYPCYY